MGARVSFPMIAAVVLGLAIAAGGMFAALVFGGQTKYVVTAGPTVTVTAAPSAPTAPTAAEPSAASETQNAAASDQGWTFGAIKPVPGWDGKKVMFTATNGNDTEQCVAVSVTGMSAADQPLASYAAGKSNIKAGETVTMQAVTIDNVPAGVTRYLTRVDLTYECGPTA